MSSTDMPPTLTDAGDGVNEPPKPPTAVGADGPLQHDEFQRQNIAPKLIPLQRGEQEELPNRRASVNTKIKIAGQTVYITTSNFPDGRLAEVFIHAARIGTFTRGMLDSFGLISAKALQFGMPVEEFVKSFRYSQFDPQGVVTGDADIAAASSILDYIAHRIELDYVGGPKIPAT